jgi:photosystem II stability/assembly factor-like uncharacterized protein
MKLGRWFGRLLLASLITAGIAAATRPGGAASVSTSSSLYSGMTWRQIGPFRGGRVPAVTGVPSQPETYYLGAAIGGVWKTTDGGHLWMPLFDHERVGSIGAIAVAPSNPDVVYVGTGESAPREDVSPGDGVYKSTDGGRSWSHIGLRDSQHIARILVDPRNPDLVLVAALGHVYGANAERGVFRSSDGGASWQKVLFKDDRTGAIELAADPDNPRTVFAALWQMQRTPWSLSSGGPGSGLYKSTDGGATWAPLSGHGLPTGVVGKIGVTVAAGTNGGRVYALVEAEQGGLYRSDDGGATWRLANADHTLWSRAWYFTKIWAHPKDPDTVFIAGGSFWQSTDGAKTFERVAIPGGDNHDFWANPQTPTRLIEANDQGVVISVNGGKTWDKRNNLPIGQFYHVSTDRAFPYFIYGAQQDMGAITIASRGWGGIGDRDWFNVGGDDGECGFVWPDPIDPRFVVAGGYNGALTLFDKRSHQLRDIAPWSNASGGHPASDLKYRFTWTSPVVYSPVDPHILYMGSQYLMETRDRGASWKVVSPDLTRNDKSKQGLSGGPITKDNASVEYYDVIFSVAPSPVQAGKIWIGTDDGLVQLTADGGTTWQKVTPPGVPEWAKISLIEASRFDASTAFVAVDAHKLDDFQPYIFRTRDDGRTWTRITTGLQAPSQVYAVREDSRRKGLLFAGTETGIYVSFDDGDQWQSLQLNLPTTSVRDMTVRGNDLIVATHGRSFWALDDISPLRLASAQLADEAVHLFAPQTALRVHEAGTYSMGVAPTGTNPPDGAVIDYYLRTKASGDVSIEILDRGGRRAHFTTSGSTDETASDEESPLLSAKDGGRRPSTDAGMHRVIWNLTYPLPRLIPGTAYDERAPRGVTAAPGTYTVKLRVSGRTYTAPLTVKNDPRAMVTQDALVAEFTLASRLMGMLGEVHSAVRQILNVRKQIDGLHKQLSSAPDAAQAVAAFEREADAVLNALYEPQAKAGVDLLNYPMQLNARIAYLEDEVDFGDGAPTAQFYEMTRLYRRELDRQLARWKTLTEAALPAMNRALQERGLPPVSVN